MFKSAKSTIKSKYIFYFEVLLSLKIKKDRRHESSTNKLSRRFIKNDVVSNPGRATMD